MSGRTEGREGNAELAEACDKRETGEL